MVEELDQAASPRRRLAALLRDLRVAAGLTGEELGARCGWTQSKVSKIETGRTPPQVGDVEAWARATGAPEEVRADLVERAEAALTEASTWRAELQQGLAAKQQRVGQLEAEATSIRVFMPSAVAGLLQTAEYARRVFTLADVTGQRDIPAAVTARLERQQILYDETKRFEFVLTEAALRWRPGPPSMLLGQLGRIASLDSLPSVEIGVIPFTVEATTLHPETFTILGGEDTLVLVETVTAELAVRDPRDVAAYVDLFGRLREQAVFSEAMTGLLDAIAEDVRRLAVQG
ncbi:MAG: helix-turn-helix domain-containing protein [Egibacteraceae bacterium]